MDDDLRRLRRACEARLRSLEIPVPFDLRALRDAIEGRRRRPIRLVAADLPGESYGVWIADRDADCIVYPRGTSAFHQRHIALHELCHILCGHQPTAVARDAYLGALLPDVCPRTVLRRLQRTKYAAEEDREAEMLASLILARAAAGPSTAPPAVGHPDVQRLADTLAGGAEGAG
jgi:hypothetical protein